MTKMDADIAIAGAGLTGRLMALALAQHGFSISLIDPAPTGGGGQDGRTTALAYAAVRLLKRLDLWTPLAADASPINDILVTNGAPADRFRDGGLSGGALHFPSAILPDDRIDEEGMPLGYIVENRAMNEAFETAVQASPHISQAYGQKVERAESIPGAKLLSLSSGQEIKTRLLIACDGKFSPIRRQMGFRTIEWPYAQKAIIFNIAHEASHKGVAHEVFYPSGPFAILPLNNDRSSIVWTEKKETADAYLNAPQEIFLQAVQDRVGPQLGNLTIDSELGAYPLTFQYTLTPARDRIVLAGDAAHTIHPIAGQGFNLGIKDVAALADVLGEAQQTGLDIGHGTVLDRYVKWRRFDTASMSIGTDVVNRLFSNDLAPIRWARGMGLGLVQQIDPARKFFMRHAGADVGDLPSLMQPMSVQ